MRWLLVFTPAQTHTRPIAALAQKYGTATLLRSRPHTPPGRTTPPQNRHPERTGPQALFNLGGGESKDLHLLSSAMDLPARPPASASARPKPGELSIHLRKNLLRRDQLSSPGNDLPNPALDLRVPGRVDLLLRQFLRRRMQTPPKLLRQLRPVVVRKLQRNSSDLFLTRISHRLIVDLGDSGRRK